MSYLGFRIHPRKILEEHRPKIESEKQLIFFVDECHLIWGDICEYLWGKTNSRIEIPIKNQKQRQTYYGVINYRTGRVIVQKYP